MALERKRPQGGGDVRRLHNLFVPAAFAGEVGLCAIGEFRCREDEGAVEILAFRRADGISV